MHSLIHYIQKALPKAFTLENVEGFRKVKEGKVFDKVIKKLEGIREGAATAYDIHHQVLNSMHFGVPQSRPRLFIVGIKRGTKKMEFNWPVPTESVFISSILDPVSDEPAGFLI